MVGQCMGPASAAEMPSWIRDALPSIVTAAVNIVSGGVLSALSTALGSIADLIDASAEALRLTAASRREAWLGSSRSLRRSWQATACRSRDPDRLRHPASVHAVHPPEHPHRARARPIPARALSSTLVTFVFGSIVLAPLIEMLNITATSLRLTKDALDTERHRGKFRGRDARESPGGAAWKAARDRRDRADPPRWPRRPARSHSASRERTSPSWIPLAPGFPKKRSTACRSSSMVRPSPLLTSMAGDRRGN